MLLKLRRFWFKPDCFLLAVCFLIFSNIGHAQIYHHNFGASTINSHPYQVVPTIINPNLSNSSWINSTGNWTSNNGVSGEAIRLTSATASTITLTFTVAPNFEASITAFDFWRQRSNFGPQNWSMTINGIAVGHGTTPTTGSAIGSTNVSNPVTGITGTVTIIISLSGNTNNGNFLLDDFKLFGTVNSNCTSALISSVFPISGPQNTLVTIEGSGFAAGTTAVKFNGINASGFIVVSDMKITAYLPAGNTSGNVSVVTNGCEGFAPNPFTTIKTVTVSNYSSNIYISELYDAQAGDGGIIELYNGTASTVNLSGYTIRRYGDIGGSSFYTINLTGSIPPGGVFLIGIGTGTIPCGWNLSQGQAYSTGFNANDEFELYQNGNLIDNVHTPGNVGYSMIRDANAVAPKSVFNNNDWNSNSSNNESCANIGSHTVTSITPPTVTAPSSKSTCEDGLVVFSSPMSNPSGYAFQWKMLNTAGIWVNVPNASPYSNANTNTLTINPVSVGFDASQYYCQITSGSNVLVSPAAQLEVTVKKTPDFLSFWNICANDVIAIPNISPNGISGTWLPVFSNTISGNYTFTPTAGQCAQTQNITINVSNKTPDFQSVWNICANDVITIGNTSPNGITGTWSAPFSNIVSGTYTFTPTGGQCAQTQIITINVSNKTPDFLSVWNICANDVITIGNTSPNGISGTWSPVFSNTVSGNYTFTPTAGQCAQTQIITINVSNKTPNFQSLWNICANDVITIGNTSPNGISGTWSPVFSNTVSGTYTFTPTVGQCAQTQIITINVSNKTPDFISVWNICANDVITIGNTSPNGISGTWSPVFSNTISGTYTFMPTVGQCARTQIITINVSNKTPDFQLVWNICANDVITIGNTSPNGISGTWSAPFSNIVSGTYTFTPTAGQCAQTQNITINVANKTPDFLSVWNICANDVITIGNTSPNGISGTWSAPFSTTVSGNYTFTPTAGQCAQTEIITINVSNRTPDFQSVWNICANDVISIGNTSPNGISGTWSAPFSNIVSGTYTFTPTGGQCAQTQIITINVSNKTPDFQSVLNICANDVISIGNISPDGISGTWSAPFSNTVSGTYTFTPTAGQCAQTQIITINVSNRIPDFLPVWNICANDVITIGNTSPNGISGTWSPVFSNTVSGNYTFTPTAGQCAQTQNITINVANKTPDFLSVWNICANDVITIGNTSPNGISGTWSPVFSNMVSGTYTFTPTVGQCAQTQIITINVSNKTPDFQSVLNICANDVITIGNTSPNGISGTWSAPFSNTVSGTYTFTPTAGQCAQTQIITINVSNRIPDFLPVWNICANDVITIGNTSPNGISGTWSPVFSNVVSGTYTFTPTAGQCAQIQQIRISIISEVMNPITGNQNVCIGASIVLSNTAAGGNWESDNIGIAAVDSMGNVTGIAVGSATISYIVRNQHCFFKVSKLITVHPIPNPILNDASICVDFTSGKVLNPAVLNSGLFGNDLEFVWTLDGNLLPTTIGEHTATSSGVYEVLVTNRLTRCQATASCTVRALAMPTATAIVSEDFSLHQTVSIQVDHGSGNYAYRLNDNPYQDYPVFYDVPSGENTIYINDLEGCNPISLSVYILNYPRFFTPNNDGYHDNWNISGLTDHWDSIIYIFDRYGKLIKSLKPSDESGWDGTFNGMPLPASDYWFQLHYHNKQNEKREFKSHFSLKR